MYSFKVSHPAPGVAREVGTDDDTGKVSRTTFKGSLDALLSGGFAKLEWFVDGVQADSIGRIYRSKDVELPDGRWAETLRPARGACEVTIWENDGCERSRLIAEGVYLNRSSSNDMEMVRWYSAVSIDAVIAAGLAEREWFEEGTARIGRVGAFKRAKRFTLPDGRKVWTTTYKNSTSVAVRVTTPIDLEPARPLMDESVERVKRWQDKPGRPAAFQAFLGKLLDGPPEGASQ